MGTLSPKQYLFIIIAQCIALLLDVSLNSFISFCRPYPTNLLILYVVQDFSIILSLTVLLVTFFSTYVLQAGLIDLLYVKFRITLFICITYLILSITVHTWQMRLIWETPLDYYWSKNFHTVYSFHRIVAVAYYYSFKRALLIIGDPRFYTGSMWMQQKVIHR